MTRDGQWRAAGAQPNDGVRPLTSAGPRSTRTEIVDPADLKTDVDRPEVPSRKVKQGKPSKRKQQADPEERDQQPLLDGYRHVATFLRADERRLHEQLLIASEKGNHRAIYLLLSQQVIDKDRCQGMVRMSVSGCCYRLRINPDILGLLISKGTRLSTMLRPEATSRCSSYCWSLAGELTRATTH